MLRPIDQYFLRQEEPARSCLDYLRSYIPSLDPHITEAWKYGMPFFCYDGKMCCYLWMHKQLRQPYIGIVEGSSIHHPQLIQEKRARMKIFLLDPAKDLPMKDINDILGAMLRFYRTGK